jgi:hypothetical protein
MKIMPVTLLVTLMATVTQAAAQYPAYWPGARDVIVITDPEVEREKVRAYENRTKVFREAQETREEESRARAYEQAKKERRAKVRRLRGK